jgi:hypothetical protein
MPDNPIRPYVRVRDLGPAGKNLAHPVTIKKWIAAGRFPGYDLRLPSGEGVWFPETYDRWEAERRAAVVEDRTPHAAMAARGLTSAK